MRFCILVAWFAGTLHAQLNGVIDIHVHSDPESVPRSIDAIDLARLAKERGMRGMVLKNHYEPTASLAYVVAKIVPGIEVFGGIDLNRSVGGVNPAAVERMAAVKGGSGTRRLAADVRCGEPGAILQGGPPVRFRVEGRELLPEVKAGDCAGGQARADAGDGTLVGAGRAADYAGSDARGGRSRGGDARDAGAGRHDGRADAGGGRNGAWLEFVYNGLIGPTRNSRFGDYAKAIREVGRSTAFFRATSGRRGIRFTRTV